MSEADLERAMTAAESALARGDEAALGWQLALEEIAELRAGLSALSSPTYWDMIEAALTFARGQAYSESTARMVDRALGAFDHLKKRVTS